MKIFVGSISYETTQKDLEELFGEFGEVLSAIVISDRETGRPKGFGFIEMADRRSAQKAIEELNDKEILGQRLVVNEARSKSGHRDSR